MADSTNARYAKHEKDFRTHHRDTFGDQDHGYDRYEPAYRTGFRHGTSDEYAGRSFSDLEAEMRRSHEREHGKGTWSSVKDAARHAFERGRRALKREQPGEEKAGTAGPSGGSHSASGDPGSIMREGDHEAMGDGGRSS